MSGGASQRGLALAMQHARRMAASHQQQQAGAAAAAAAARGWQTRPSALVESPAAAPPPVAGHRQPLLHAARFHASTSTNCNSSSSSSSSSPWIWRGKQQPWPTADGDRRADAAGDDAARWRGARALPPMLAAAAHQQRRGLSLLAGLAGLMPGGSSGSGSHEDDDDAQAAAARGARAYRERRLVGYPPQQLFSVIADVARYREFVPWCRSSRVIREDASGARMEAELEVGFQALSERYVSHVRLQRPGEPAALAAAAGGDGGGGGGAPPHPPPPGQTPPVAVVEATTTRSMLFEHLASTWTLRPGPQPGTTWLAFAVEFGFASPAHRHVADLFFDQVVRRMVAAFEGRCAELYGASALEQRRAGGGGQGGGGRAVATTHGAPPATGRGSGGRRAIAGESDAAALGPLPSAPPPSSGAPGVSRPPLPPLDQGEDPQACYTICNPTNMTSLDGFHGSPSMLLYFAYGSMCNRESLRRRGIRPVASCPAILAGWTLCFDNTGGMADVREGMPEAEAVAAKGAEGAVFCIPWLASSSSSREAQAAAGAGTAATEDSGGGGAGGPPSPPPPPYLHGILHLITRAEFAALAKIEAVYTYRDLPVTPYGPQKQALLARAAAEGACGASAAAAAAAAAADAGADGGADGQGASPPSVPARVFIGTAEAKSGARSAAAPRGRELPTDRYLGIICAGLEEHAADARWVGRVRALPCEQTPGPGEHRRLPGFLTRGEELAAAAAAAAAAARAGEGGASAEPAPPLLPRRSRGWLRAREGVVSPCVVFALGPRVFRAELAPGAAFAPIVKAMIAGREAAAGFNLNLYDPRMPPLGPVDEATGLPGVEDVHVAYAEDHFARMLASAAAGGGGGGGGAGAGAGGAGLAFRGPIEHVGWLVGDGEENDDGEEGA